MRWRLRGGRGGCGVSTIARRSRCLRRLAGVVDADGSLVHVNKKGEPQEMRANTTDTKEQARGLGDTYSRRKWQRTAASGGAPVRECGSLGAWDGVGDAGNETGE